MRSHFKKVGIYFFNQRFLYPSFASVEIGRFQFLKSTIASDSTVSIARDFPRPAAIVGLDGHSIRFPQIKSQVCLWQWQAAFAVRG